MKNWKTNVVGAILICVGVYMYIKTQDWTQASLCIVMGTGFFMSKDYNKTGK